MSVFRLKALGFLVLAVMAFPAVAGTVFVRVKDDKGNDVQGVTVDAQSTILPAEADCGESDGAGLLVLHVDFCGDPFKVTATKAGYKPFSATVDLKDYEDDGYLKCYNIKLEPVLKPAAIARAFKAAPRTRKGLASSACHAPAR